MMEPHVKRSEGKGFFQMWMNLKLKTQIWVLIGLSLLMVAGVGLLSFASARQMLMRRAVLFEENMIRQIQGRVAEEAADMKNLGLVVAYANPVQEWLQMEDPRSRAESFESIRALLLSYQGALHDAYAILLVDRQGRVTDAVPQFLYDDVGGFLETLELADPQPTDVPVQGFTPVWPMQRKERDHPFYAYIKPVYESSAYMEQRACIGHVLVLRSVTPLQDAFSAISTDSGAFLMVDSRQTLVASTVSDRPNASRITGRKETAMPEQQWTLVSMVNAGVYPQEYLPLRNAAFGLAGMSFLLLVMIGIMLMRSITRPMGQIVRFLDAYPRAVLKERMVSGPRNEMGVVVHHINKLMDKMEDISRSMLDTQSRLYEAELEGRRSQFAALQNQINPHFLYNTLDCIRGMALAFGAGPIADMSLAMAKVYRYGIQPQGEVLLQEELDVVRHYFHIVEVRQSGRIKLLIDVPPELLGKPVLRMIIQPLVENAVYHGLEPKEGPGTIWLKARLQDDLLLLSVRDDGMGIDAAVLDNLRDMLDNDGDRRAPGTDDLRKTTGIGLLNIHRRLVLHDGVAAGLRVHGGLHAGFTVEVRIPQP